MKIEPIRDDVKSAPNVGSHGMLYSIGFTTNCIASYLGSSPRSKEVKSPTRRRAAEPLPGGTKVLSAIAISYVQPADEIVSRNLELGVDLP